MIVGYSNEIVSLFGVELDYEVYVSLNEFLDVLEVGKVDFVVGLNEIK